MFKNVVFRIMAGLVLLAAIAGIAFFAFRAGVDYSTAANLSATGEQTVMPFLPYYGMHPFMGFFGLLFVFFLIALAFGSLRRLVWGPRWGWRHMGHGPMGSGPMGRGPMGHYGPCGEDVPPMVAEWHKRMHAEAEKPAEQK